MKKTENSPMTMLSYRSIGPDAINFKDTHIFKIEQDIEVHFLTNRTVILRYFNQFDVELPIRFNSLTFHAFYEPSTKRLIIYNGGTEAFYILTVHDADFEYIAVPFQYHNNIDPMAERVDVRFLGDGGLAILGYFGLYVLNSANQIKW